MSKILAHFEAFPDLNKTRKKGRIQQFYCLRDGVLTAAFASGSGIVDCRLSISNWRIDCIAQFGAESYQAHDSNDLGKSQSAINNWQSPMQ
jgi:hypothetical protein